MTAESNRISSPPRELLRAVDEFNRGDWFTCHETLELLWAGSWGETRQVYQGVLQIAVGLHHWRNGNFSGAISLLAKGARRLRLSPCRDQIQTEELSAAADRFREALTPLGPERMDSIDPSLIPLLRLVTES